MLLYIIFIVIIYLTDTYICKKTISHILLTYKNNFLTNKILDCFGTKILVIVYKSLVRFKDECNNITLGAHLGCPRTASLLYKYPNIPKTLGESTKYSSSRRRVQNHQIQSRHHLGWGSPPPLVPLR